TPCDPGFFNDLVIIRGIVVVIVGGLILLDGRFSVLLGRWFTGVLGDHVGKPGPCGLGLFTFGLFGSGGRGDDVAKAAFELFAQFGFGFGKGRGKRFLTRDSPRDESCIAVGG